MPNKGHICGSRCICTVVNERAGRRRFVLLLFVTKVPAQGSQPDGLSIREGRGIWKAFSCLHDGGLAFVVSARVFNRVNYKERHYTGLEAGFVFITLGRRKRNAGA